MYIKLKVWDHRDIHRSRCTLNGHTKWIGALNFDETKIVSGAAGNLQQHMSCHHHMMMMMIGNKHTKADPYHILLYTISLLSPKNFFFVGMLFLLLRLLLLFVCLQIARYRCGSWGRAGVWAASNTTRRPSARSSLTETVSSRGPLTLTSSGGRSYLATGTTASSSPAATTTNNFPVGKQK